jgi:hypothetical protein
MKKTLLPIIIYGATFPSYEDAVDELHDTGVLSDIESADAIYSGIIDGFDWVQLDNHSSIGVLGIQIDLYDLYNNHDLVKIDCGKVRDLMHASHCEIHHCIQEV